MAPSAAPRTSGNPNGQLKVLRPLLCTKLTMLTARHALQGNRCGEDTWVSMITFAFCQIFFSFIFFTVLTIRMTEKDQYETLITPALNTGHLAALIRQKRSSWIWISLGIWNRNVWKMWWYVLYFYLFAKKAVTLSNIINTSTADNPLQTSATVIFHTFT